MALMNRLTHYLLSRKFRVCSSKFFVLSSKFLVRNLIRNRQSEINNGRLVASCLLAIASCLLFVSCKNHQHPGKKIFHYNEDSGIPTLDPVFAKSRSVVWATHQLFNSLVELDSNMKVKPSLADSWDISDDNLSFTFHLRNDVYFHDDIAFPNGKGRKMTAADVVYSFERLIDPAVASPGAWLFNNKVNSTDAFKAINDSTFQLKLNHPFQPILGILCMQYCSIVAKEAVEKYKGDFRSHPVGTGPFRFIAWEEGQSLILAKNEHYFETDEQGQSLPYLDGVKVLFNDSKATEFLEFQQQRIDFINDIDPSFKDEILTKTGHLKAQWKDKIELHKHAYLNIEFLGILSDADNPLVQSSPLRMQQIRQAINYGFDRRRMMLYLRNSIGTPAESGFVPMGLPSFDTAKVKGYHYDVNKAKQLLAAAGYPGGKGLSPIKLLTIPTYADLASYVANELQQIGVTIQVEVVQKSLLLEQTAKSKALFYRGGWIADYPDAENYLSVFYSKNPAPPNYTRYKNPAYDLLYEKAIAEKNDSLRYLLYQQLDQLVMNDAPVVPLWYDMVIHLVHTNIQNFQPTGLNLLELRTVKKE